MQTTYLLVKTKCTVQINGNVSSVNNNRPTKIIIIIIIEFVMCTVSKKSHNKQ